MLCKRTFAAAVVPNDGYKCSIFDRKRNVVQRALNGFFILKNNVIKLNQSQKVLSKIETIIQDFFTFFK